MLLTHDNKKELLQIAMESINNSVLNKPASQVENSNPELNELSGAFVTLNYKGKLRGCIGMINPIYPLYKVVRDVARSAAVEDPRFMPLQKKELDDIKIEISVLRDFKELESVEQIEIGVHGIIISKGNNKGLLLPQVAKGQKWNQEEFLTETCLKANLPYDAWKDKDTKVEIFSADVFSESDISK